MKYLKKYRIIIFISIVFLVFIPFFFKKEEISAEPIEVLEKQELNKEEIEEVIYVDIKGSVNSPGVFKLNQGDRIIDAINISGGLLENADTSNINLSKKVFDEMVIVINPKKETIECNCQENIKNSEEKLEYNKDGIIENQAQIKNDAIFEETEDDIKQEENNQKISLNNATKEQLMTLPGIGESKALSIIEYRSNNLFKRIDEIMNIKGIGNSIYEKIKEYITI